MNTAEIFFPQRWTWTVVKSWFKARHPKQFKLDRWCGVHRKCGINTRTYLPLRQWVLTVTLADGVMENAK